MVGWGWISGLAPCGWRVHPTPNPSPSRGEASGKGWAFRSGRVFLFSSRRILSIGRKGRKSEASLGIGGLQYPFMGFAAALADELDLPARPAHARKGELFRRGAADPPAGDRRRGKAERIGAGAAPAPQH